ncbi:hypothetical protein G9A89_014902 [Geosiphon pyriformis]|nr:hypothetical protein G9A89_014902 [Geosiphon pyriformis]
MNSTIRSLKTSLRKEMRKILTEIPSEVIERESRAVAEKLVSLPSYLNSKNVSIYLSMTKGEIQTNFLIKDIFKRGKSCYVPRWTGEMMEMVRVISFEDYLSLPVNKWNIPEPSHNEEREVASNLDLIVMPGMAFDVFGNRLGHGKGYYDRYLMKIKKITKEESRDPPITVALALEAQILKERMIPTCGFDQKPDLVLSATQIIKEKSNSEN